MDCFGVSLIAHIFPIIENYSQELISIIVIFVPSENRNNTAMEVISASWITARLKGERGEKARLAEAAGISPTKLSNILSDIRTVTQDEAARIREFFGEEEEVAPHVGFEENEATPFDGPKSEQTEIIKTLAGRAKHPSIFITTKSAPELGYLEGDALIVDMGTTAQNGDCVLATIADPNTGNSRTFLGKLLHPWIISGKASEMAVSLEDERYSIAVLGLIHASFRSKQ